MKRIYSVVFLAALCSLAVNTPFAAINPADPGLAPANSYDQLSIPNNGASALCVECHTANPSMGGSTHFVMNSLTGTLRTTNSGGGWSAGQWGVRNGGEFYKLTPWSLADGGNGGSSKYGDSSSWESVVYVDDVAPMAQEASWLETSAEAIKSTEIICESCHSLRVNILGRNNLLARIVNSDVPDEQVEGSIADLCVGCHGFLYHDDQGLANSLNANWYDPRNFSITTGLRRENNELHYIGGQSYPRNHHVMSGDVIDLPLVQAGLMVRDVKVMNPGNVSIPIKNNSRIGTMPIKIVVESTIPVPTNTSNLHCVTCHMPAHGGDPTMGAAFLRGENLGGLDSGYGIDRIFDGKTWGRYRDRNFCTQCHE